MLASFFQIQPQVSAGVDVHVQGAIVNHHKALYRSVAYTGLRISGDYHTGIKIRPTVFLCVHRNGQIRQRQPGLPLKYRTVVHHHRINRCTLPLFNTAGYVLW